MSGTGVVTASALAAAAPTGAVWVSATVRTLVASAGVELAAEGVQALGAVGSQPVFAAG